MRYLQLAEKHELPRIISIKNPYSLLNQNPYSLLNRSVEIGLLEISQYEGSNCWPIPAWRSVL